MASVPEKGALAAAAAMLISFRSSSLVQCGEGSH
jgi:hypothetical protein